MTTTQETFQEKLARKREERAQATQTSPRTMPDFNAGRKQETSHFRKGGLLDQAKELSLSDDAKAIDELVDNLPMREAIKLWGKPQSEFKQVGESTILIRCPKPEHPDNNPSASASLIEQVYHCHACSEGGDKYTLAALHHGFGNDYQQGKHFVDLKAKIATDLGYTVTESGGQTTLTPAHTNPELPAPAIEPVSFPVLTEAQQAEQQPAQPQQPPAPIGPVPISFDDVDLGEDAQSRIMPALDWLPAGKNGSFIDRYVGCTLNDRYPESLAFGAALLCLSFIAERNVTMDMSDELKANFGMVLLAPSGSGKSRAYNHAKRVLQEVMPWRRAELAIGMAGHVTPNSGVKFVTGAGSGENLIKQFQDIVKVPNGSGPDGTPNPPIEEPQPVSGLINFAEFSQFVGKSSAIGSTLRERVMEFLDGYDKVESHSNTAGDYEAIDSYACLYTSVQPAVVHKLMSGNDESSGFLNRFMFFTGRQKPRQPFRQPPTDMSDAIKGLKDLKDFWDAKGEVKLDDSLIWDMKYDYLVKTVDPLIEHSGKDIFNRLDVVLHKLLILLCINEKATVITPDIFNKAVHLHSYFIETYRYLSAEMYDPSLMNAEPTIEDRIIAKVAELTDKKKAKGAEEPADYSSTASDIKAGLRRQLDKSRFGATEQLNKSLRTLVESGDLVKIQGQRGAKYFVNPNI